MTLACKLLTRNAIHRFYLYFLPNLLFFFTNWRICIGETDLSSISSRNARTCGSTNDFFTINRQLRFP